MQFEFFVILFKKIKKSLFFLVFFIKFYMTNFAMVCTKKKRKNIFFYITKHTQNRNKQKSTELQME